MPVPTPMSNAVKKVELTAPRWPRSAMFSFMVWKVGMKMPNPKPIRMAEV